MTDVDLSEFEALSNPKKRACQVGTARDQLSAKERKQLDAAVIASAAGEITGGAIVKWLEHRGHTVSHSAVTAHRARRCLCHARA